MDARTGRTEAIRARFLRALEQCGNVSGSCHETSISRTQVYAWRNADPAFAAQWDAALELGADSLEDEAKRRAMAGSDGLLVFLLRALRPQTYQRPTTVNLTDICAFDYRTMTREELVAALRELRAAQQDDPPTIPDAAASVA